MSEARTGGASASRERAPRRRRIGVVGAASAEPAVLEEAHAVGRALAEAGAILVCGGRGGVMEAAGRGARSAGGLTLGILPGESAGEANRWVDIPVVTGLGEARNVIVARTSEALIALPGGAGTLSEIAFALKFARPVIALGDWDFDPAIVLVEDPREAVRRALQAAGEAGARG